MAGPICWHSPIRPLALLPLLGLRGVLGLQSHTVTKMPCAAATAAALSCFDPQKLSSAENQKFAKYGDAIDAAGDAFHAPHSLPQVVPTSLPFASSTTLCTPVIPFPFLLGP